MRVLAEDVFHEVDDAVIIGIAVRIVDAVHVLPLVGEPIVIVIARYGMFLEEIADTVAVRILFCRIVLVVPELPAVLQPVTVAVRIVYIRFRIAVDISLWMVIVVLIHPVGPVLVFHPVGHSVVIGIRICGVRT